jgi:hypothetical protein
LLHPPYARDCQTKGFPDAGFRRYGNSLRRSVLRYRRPTRSNIDFRMILSDMTFTQYLPLFQFYLSCRR